MLVQIRSCHKLPYGEKPPGGVPSPARHGAGAPSPGFPRRVLTRAKKAGNGRGKSLSAGYGLRRGGRGSG